VAPDAFDELGVVLAFDPDARVAGDAGLQAFDAHGPGRRDLPGRRLRRGPERHERDRLAFQQEPGGHEREDAVAAFGVLEHDVAVLDLHHRAAVAAGRVLDHQAGLGGDLRHLLAAAAGEHVVIGMGAHDQAT
jgi:hypothetical protein